MHGQTVLFISGTLQGVAAAIYIYDRFWGGKLNSRTSFLLAKARPWLPVVIACSIIVFTISGLIIVAGYHETATRASNDLSQATNQIVSLSNELRLVKIPQSLLHVRTNGVASVATGDIDRSAFLQGIQASSVVVTVDNSTHSNYEDTNLINTFNERMTNIISSAHMPFLRAFFTGVEKIDPPMYGKYDLKINIAIINESDSPALHFKEETTIEVTNGITYFWPPNPEAVEDVIQPHDGRRLSTVFDGKQLFDPIVNGRAIIHEQFRFKDVLGHDYGLNMSARNSPDGFVNTRLELTGYPEHSK